MGSNFREGVRCAPEVMFFIKTSRSSSTPSENLSVP